MWVATSKEERHADPRTQVRSSDSKTTSLASLSARSIDREYAKAHKSALSAPVLPRTTRCYLYVTLGDLCATKRAFSERSFSFLLELL